MTENLKPGENFSTDGYSWKVEENEDNFSKEQLLQLACRKSSKSVLETLLYSHIWSFDFIRNAVVDPQISNDMRTVRFLFVIKNQKKIFNNVMTCINILERQGLLQLLERESSFLKF